LLKVYVMTVLPAAIPDNTPVDAPMVATEVLLLLHVPPGAPLVNELVLPRQADDEPVIEAGVWLTVTTVLAGVPQPFEYDIVAVPTVAPVMMPVVAPAMATEGLLLVQLPTPPALDSVVVVPVQNTAVPDIDGSGEPLTTNVPTAKHPLAV
jgi:hypothetical protein